MVGLIPAESPRKVQTLSGEPPRRFMQNQKLAAIAKRAADDLIGLVNDEEAKILEAWSACEQEAQDNETKPKFKLSLAITLDLDADKMESALTFGIRRKVSVDSAIPDPTQTDLPLEGVSITIDAKAAALLREAADQMQQQ